MHMWSGFLGSKSSRVHKVFRSEIISNWKAQHVLGLKMYEYHVLRIVASEVGVSGTYISEIYVLSSHPDYLPASNQS